MDDTAAGQGGGLGRLVVVNWAPDALGLVRALQELGAESLTLLGTDAPEAVEAALVGPRSRCAVRYMAASVGDGVESFAEQLAGAVEVATARAIIVLPQRGRGETDAFSRLACTAIHRARELLREWLDPIADRGHPILDRAALPRPIERRLDLAVFRFMLALLHGGLRVQTWPVPDALRGKAFRDACQQVEADPDGHPVTVLGLALAGEPGMLVNPGPAQPLADAVGLLVLTGQGS